jgi:hypothetical protein
MEIKSGGVHDWGCHGRRRRRTALLVSVANRHLVLAVLALFACLAAGAPAQQGGAAPELAYDARTRGPVPIPPSERTLQAVVAEPWFKVSDDGLVLEGPAFDRDGGLLFCDVSGGRVLRVTPEKRLSAVLTEAKLSARRASRSTRTGASSSPPWARREPVPSWR